jgi:hypothetical protein
MCIGIDIDTPFAIKSALRFESVIGMPVRTTMTTMWGAPRAAYLLALAMALEDEQGQNELWEKVSRTGGETDLLIALGAQARLMARTAATANGKPFDVPDAAWERIACRDVRDFAMAAYTGGELHTPCLSCARCLRIAAEMLAGVHLAAIDAAGIPRTWLAEVCARIPETDEPITSPASDAGAAVGP